MTMGSFSCALECKLQTVKCLTLVGTEGFVTDTHLIEVRVSEVAALARIKRI